MEDAYRRSGTITFDMDPPKTTSSLSLRERHPFNQTLGSAMGLIQVCDEKAVEAIEGWFSSCYFVYYSCPLLIPWSLLHIHNIKTATWWWNIQNFWVMPWSPPLPPSAMVAVVLGRTASLMAAECLFRGTLLGLMARGINEDVARVWKYLFD